MSQDKHDDLHVLLDGKEIKHRINSPNPAKTIKLLKQMLLYVFLTLLLGLASFIGWLTTGSPFLAGFAAGLIPGIVIGVVLGMRWVVYAAVEKPDEFIKIIKT